MDDRGKDLPLAQSSLVAGGGIGFRRTHKLLDMNHFKNKQSEITKSKTNMKSADQGEVTSGIGSRQGLILNSAAASLASQASDERASDKTAIRPFHIDVPEAELNELGRRQFPTERTRFPCKSTRQRRQNSILRRQVTHPGFGHCRNRPNQQICCRSLVSQLSRPAGRLHQRRSRLGKTLL